MVTHVCHSFVPLFMDTEILLHAVAKLCYTPEAAATVRQWPATLLRTVLNASITRLRPVEAVEILEDVGAQGLVNPVSQATLNMHLERYSKKWLDVPEHVDNFLKTLIVGPLQLSRTSMHSSLSQPPTDGCSS